MATLWEMTKERVKGIVFKPENQVLRDAKAESRAVREEQKLEEQEVKAEHIGDLTRVQVIMKKISGLEKKKAFRLFNQLVQIRLIASNQLRRVGYLKHAIADDLAHDKNLSEEKRGALAQEFEAQFVKIHDDIATVVNSIFRAETSFESINASLKSLLRTDTLARDLVNNYRKAKRAAKIVNREEKGLEKKARNVKAVEDPAFLKRIALFLKHLDDERKYLVEASTYTLQLLQDDVHDAESKKKHLDVLIHEAGFPKYVGEELIRNFDETLRSIHDLLQSEIAKKRIEISNVDRDDEVELRKAA